MHKNMRQPVRQAPSVEVARQKLSRYERYFSLIILSLIYVINSNQAVKKKPPPRPPPPDFTRIRSKSAWNLNQNIENLSLIEWSPPQSPKTNRPSGGSVYSSFSSSTSSLASSKRSSEYESIPFNVVNSLMPTDNLPKNSNMPVFNLTWSAKLQQEVASKQNEQVTCVPQISMPTIIRAQGKCNGKLKTASTLPEGPTHSRNISPPMPMGPPPSPPKEVSDITVPCAVAIHNFPGTQAGDLALEENDIVYLLRRINGDWLYGKVGDKEGMFPENFVDIQVGLPEDKELVTALYDFCPQMKEDLALKPGQKIKVLKVISSDWLLGESNGKVGQFPANFVEPVPKI